MKRHCPSALWISCLPVDKTCLLVGLLSCLFMVAGCNDRNQPVKHSRAKPRVPPFHYVYYDYGGPPEPHVSKAQAVVLKKYGLSHQGFGCVVTDALKQAVHQHNDSLFAGLQPAFPGLSEDRLQQEIQTYTALHPTVDNAQ